MLMLLLLRLLTNLDVISQAAATINCMLDVTLYVCSPPIVRCALSAPNCAIPITTHAITFPKPFLRIRTLACPTLHVPTAVLCALLA